MTLILIYIVLLAGGAPKDVCPDPAGGTLTDLKYVLTSDNDANLRDEAGISSTEAASIVRVTDASTCDLIRMGAQAHGIETITDHLGFRYVFYRTSDHYYLIPKVIPRTDDKFDLGLYPYVVMTRSYEVKFAFLR